jgi:acyl-CoA dehydrogenase
MEVLLKYGTPEQKAQWLEPLLNGEIRSAFGMTEPGVASSDATNMAATAIVDGDEVVINGRKWFSTGVGHPDCKIMVFMGLSNPDADRHHRHTMVLVPMDSPGVKIDRMLTTMNVYDEPVGHGEVTFDEVRVPVSNILLGEGRAFEIAQGRLGPGRIHHCLASPRSRSRWRSSGASRGRRLASRWSSSGGTRSGSRTPGSPSIRRGCSCSTPPGSSTSAGR